MNDFFTRVKVDLSRITTALPKGSEVQQTVWDPKTGEIEVRWTCRNLVTPFTFPVGFPLEKLESQELPAQVTVRGQKEESPAVPTQPPPQLTLPKTIDKVRLGRVKAVGTV